MKRVAPEPADPAERLRAEAEARVARHRVDPKPTLPARSQAHELQVYQIELEMQNEELRRAQTALEAARDRYVDLYDFAPVGYFTLDAEGLITELNLTGATLLGGERRRLVGSRFARLVAPAHADRWHHHTCGLRLHGEPQRIELALRTADGRVLDAQLDGLRVDEPDAAPALRFTLTDIGERKRGLLALQASQAFLDRTGRVAGVGGWEWDLRNDTITWSTQTCLIHDLEPGHRPSLAEATGYVLPEARASVQAAVDAARRFGTAYDLELPLVTARGRPIWVRACGEVEYEGGVPTRLVGALQDITEQRRRQVELAREQAQRAQAERHASELDRLLRERGDMLDVMAHEVRQPLNNASAALQSAAGALAEVGEKVASLRLTRAQTVMGQVLARIDNTLAVAALLAHPDPIQLEDTDVDTLVAVAIADLPAAERGRIHVERVTGTRTASMDMSLMRLALRNVLANALSYSPAGSPVTVRLSDSDEPLALVIEVCDTGPGVPAALVPRLFDRGTRGAQPGAPSGQGLGLYIVRRVMELHGGAVALSRNAPGGATFCLVIEQAPCD